MFLPERSLTEALAGRYVVEESVGSGGMAVVYRAHDVRHERKVALKVLRSELSSTLGGERFLREIKVAARLQHPHILPLHDSGEAGGSLYFVMPLVEGETLRSRLTREGQLPVDEALRIASEVADALHYAHERDIVHRDVKPENIMLTSGHAMVMDFGIARAISNAGGMMLTEKGMAIGTPAYMSPEQATDTSRVDGRSDVYALGCVLYEMLTGIAPFTGPTPQVVLMRHSVEAPAPLRGMRPLVTPELEQVVLKAMSKSPADRYSTAREFGAAIRSISMGLAPRARPRRGLVAAGIVAGAILVGGLTYWTRGQAAAADPVVRIAVAPLRAPAGDTAASYLVDGLSEDITLALTRVRGLAPRPYSTVAAAAKVDPNPLAIGTAVRADYVLVMTLRRIGESIVIKPEVVQLRDSSMAPWTPQVFQGHFDNTQAMSEQITNYFVGGLSQRFALGRAVARRPVDPEAYKLYLEALRYANVIYPEAVKRRDLLTKAVQIDSNFADGWAQLGNTLGWMTQVSGEAPTEIRALQSAALDRAIDLDSLNAVALFARAGIRWDGGRHEDAERDYRRALLAAPNDPWAHAQYAKFIDATVRDVDSALAEVARARKLDPTESHFAMLTGYLRIWKGDFAGADSALDQAAALKPNDWVVNTMRLRMAWRRGEPAAGLAFARRAVELQGGDDPFSLSQLGYAFGAAGMADSARAVLRKIQDMAARRYVKHPWLAIAACGAGDHEAAIRELQQGASSRDGDMILALQELDLDLRADPRYAEVVRRLRLDEWWTGRPLNWYRARPVCSAQK
jgi:serine/threonine-protein kinase